MKHPSRSGGDGGVMGPSSKTSSMRLRASVEKAAVWRFEDDVVSVGRSVSFGNKLSPGPSIIPVGHFSQRDISLTGRDPTRTKRTKNCGLKKIKTKKKRRRVSRTNFGTLMYYPSGSEHSCMGPKRQSTHNLFLAGDRTTKPRS